jgi:DNA-binding HxlR family transcriptional regulator
LLHYFYNVPRKPESCRRSGCPVNISLEMIGDRWSLLIIRDMMLRGFRTYREFLNSEEGIATNILADRLRKLEGAGIVITSRDPADRRKLIYKLTQKGVDLGPVLLELALWSARHADTDAPPAMIERMEKNRASFLAEIRKKWQQNHPR